MQEAKPQYRTLREAIISANLQTGGDAEARMGL